MSRIFEHFNDTSICPICGTSKDEKTILAGIDETGDGNIEEAIQVHLDCLLSRMRYKREMGIFYARTD